VASPGSASTHTAHRSWRPSKQAAAFAALFLVYILVTLGVIFRSPLLTLDTDLFKLNLRHHYPEWKRWVHLFVIVGQRGPATLFFLPWFLWVAWRDRSPRPLVLLVTSLILLNLSVGIVKLAIGRIGPLQTHQVRDVFVGGDIYPSGHVSNTVVLYGLIAWIAINHRKIIIAIATFLSVAVGLCTVYLDTHWFSDVIGGWIAGGLVLLALPWVEPTAEAWTLIAWARVRPWLARYVKPLRESPPAAAPVERPVVDVDQPNETPVSSVASAHSFAATPVSLDARDESTRRGKPRSSPIPSGP
jgi:membrane-associated phospholipid phosphatase